MYVHSSGVSDAAELLEINEAEEAAGRPAVYGLDQTQIGIFHDTSGAVVSACDKIIVTKGYPAHSYERVLREEGIEFFDDFANTGSVYEGNTRSLALRQVGIKCLRVSLYHQEMTDLESDEIIKNQRLNEQVTQKSSGLTLLSDVIRQYFNQMSLGEHTFLVSREHVHTNSHVYTAARAHNKLP